MLPLCRLLFLASLRARSGPRGEFVTSRFTEDLRSGGIGNLLKVARILGQPGRYKSQSDSGIYAPNSSPPGSPRTRGTHLSAQLCWKEASCAAHRREGGQPRDQAVNAGGAPTERSAEGGGGEKEGRRKVWRLSWSGGPGLGAPRVGVCRQGEQYAWKLREQGGRCAQGTASNVPTDRDLLQGRVPRRRPTLRSALEAQTLSGWNSDADPGGFWAVCQAGVRGE